MKTFGMLLAFIMLFVFSAPAAFARDELVQWYKDGSLNGTKVQFVVPVRVIRYNKGDIRTGENDYWSGLLYKARKDDTHLGYIYINKFIEKEKPGRWEQILSNTVNLPQVLPPGPYAVVVNTDKGPIQYIGTMKDGTLIVQIGIMNDVTLFEKPIL